MRTSTEKVFLRREHWSWAALLLVLATTAQAQSIDSRRGVDPGVDYAAFTRIGPWDDRNYQLTKEDLAYLAPNEAEQRDPIPVFFRVELRKAFPDLRRSGPAQYPLSALQSFLQKYGGYLIGGQVYTKVEWREERFFVIEQRDAPAEESGARALTGEVKVTSPVGATESAVKISPTDANRVIAGVNHFNGGIPSQKMFFSTNGGSTWTAAGPLFGATSGDPTVDWSADGTKAYTATLGNCWTGCEVWFYRSGDGGQTWTDLGADPRREVSTVRSSDKEYIHVDKSATSPFRDHIYVTWHDNNVMKFARSTDLGQTFSPPLAIAPLTPMPPANDPELGVGSDIATDKSGNIYYIWPAINSLRILLKKSTNGGASFGATIQVASTQNGFNFAIPAMETRLAATIVAADVDLTGGPFANRVYVAWTDTTKPEAEKAADNHARIQVAFSADGGATWTVKTPHETVGEHSMDTVDRFHPWLAVGPDGTVYVAFYDTRVAGRTSVDFFYSKSTDGGNTWSMPPSRLTSVTSPGIQHVFEWGDYNGLDVLGSQLISAFTDNRNESGGTVDSIDVYAAGATVVGGTVTETFQPEGANGHIVESTETSGVGGTILLGGGGGAAHRVGDTAIDQQYRSILSFHTGSIPDGATIVSAQLQLKRGTVTGTNPFTTHGSCRVDVHNRFFGTGIGLEAVDFQAAATAVNVATLSNPTTDGALSTATLNAAGRGAINRLGRTQFRLYCTLDDDDDGVSDIVGFYAGNNSIAANRPKLVVTYR